MDDGAQISPAGAVVVDDDDNDVRHSACHRRKTRTNIPRRQHQQDGVRKEIAPVSCVRSGRMCTRNVRAGGRAQLRWRWTMRRVQCTWGKMS